MKNRLAFAALLPALLLVAPAAPAEAPSARVFAPRTLSFAGRPEEVGFDSKRLQRLGDYVEKTVADGKLAGATVLVARKGKIVAFDTYGRRTVGGAPVTRDTIFRIYSMTKPVTGVALMMLLEEGKFRLDDPVTMHIPEFRDLKVATGFDPEGRPILEEMKRPPTIRELMSHSAGFGYGLSAGSPADDLYRRIDPLNAGSMAEFAERTARVPLLFQPGTRYQ